MRSSAPLTPGRAAGDHITAWSSSHLLLDRDEPRQTCRTELQTVCGNNLSYGENVYDGRFYGKRQASPPALNNSNFTTKTFIGSAGASKVSGEAAQLRQSRISADREHGHHQGPPQQEPLLLRAEEGLLHQLPEDLPVCALPRLRLSAPPAVRTERRPVPECAQAEVLLHTGEARTAAVPGPAPAVLSSSPTAGSRCLVLCWLDNFKWSNCHIQPRPWKVGLELSSGIGNSFF